MTTTGYVGHKSEDNIRHNAFASQLHSQRSQRVKASSPYELFPTERGSDLVVFFWKPPTGRLRAGREKLGWDLEKEGAKGGLV